MRNPLQMEDFDYEVCQPFVGLHSGRLTRTGINHQDCVLSDRMVASDLVRQYLCHLEV